MDCRTYLDKFAAIAAEIQRLSAGHADGETNLAKIAKRLESEGVLTEEQVLSIHILWDIRNTCLSTQDNKAQAHPAAAAALMAVERHLGLSKKAPEDKNKKPDDRASNVS